jgi:hypothetical protein
MSNRLNKVNTFKVSGLRLPAKSMASSRCGINVPRADAMAIMMRSATVSLTELNNCQNGFEFFRGFGCIILYRALS